MGHQVKTEVDGVKEIWVAGQLHTELPTCCVNAIINDFLVGRLAEDEN